MELKTPTPNLIKLQNINNELERLENRVRELHGEQTTLEATMQFWGMDLILYNMRCECIKYEVDKIIKPRLEQLQVEYDVINMLISSNVELS
jgi:hypothetical protein